MDTNAQNHQTNTFEKGMNLDIQDLLMPTNLYREAHNLRFVPDSNGEGGLLKIIEGGLLVMFDYGQDLYKPYLEDDSDDTMTVIKVTKCRDLLILITENGLKHWYVFTLQVYDENPQPPLLFGEPCFGPCTTPLGDTISVATRYESDSVVKLYIADNKGPLKIINVKLKYSSSDINSVLSNNNGLVTPIKIKSETLGNIVAETVLYVYYYYNKYTIRSGLSPITPLYSISNGEGGSALAGVDYDLVLTIGLKLEVPHSNIFEYIKIYRIQYKQSVYSPSVVLIYDDKQTSDGIYEDNGLRNISLATLEELFSSEYVIYPNIIEPKDNRLFAANLNNEFWNNSDTGIKKSDFDNWNATAFTNDMESNLDFSDKWNESVWWNGTDGDHISWKFKTITGNLDYGVGSLLVNIGFYPPKKSLRRDEIYRYGIVLYDRSGKKYPVKWIADIRTPDNTLKPIMSVDEVYHLCVEFKIKDLPTNAVAYEIVRCERTLLYQHNITQGVVSLLFGCITENENIDNNVLCGSPYITTDKILSIVEDGNDTFVNSNQAAQNKNYILFFSPEISYQPDDIYNILKSTSNITILPHFYVADTSSEIYRYPSNPLQPVEDIRLYHQSLAWVDIYMCYTWLSLKQNDVNYGNFLAFVNDNSEYSLQYATFSQQKKDLLLSLNLAVSFTLSFSETTEANKQQIQSVIIPKTQNPENFEGSSNDILILDQFETLDGTFKYLLWNIPRTVGRNSTGFNDDDTQPIGLASRCALLKLANISQFYTDWDDIDAPDLLALNDVVSPKTLLCSILKPLSSIYGGTSTEARNNSEYKSHGCFYTTDNINTWNTVEDGDTHILSYEFYSQHTYNAKTKKGFGRKCAMIYSVPIETSINIAFDYGAKPTRREIEDHTTNLLGLYLLEPWQVTANVYTTLSVILPTNPGYTLSPTTFVQSKPMFAYNVGYSAESVSTTFTSLSDLTSPLNEDCRVAYSQVKNNLETEDSWIKFKAINYLDVDNRYGLITNLMSFANKLFFWQENSFGVLSVNERAQISSGDGRQLILGTGGVLERFDYYSTESGMRRGDFSADHSDNAIYWIDRGSRDLYKFLQGVQSLSKQYGILMLTNSYDWNVTPTICFDKRYSEVLFNAFTGEKSTIVFNEQMNSFLSFYTIDFDHSVRFNKTLILLNNNFFYKWNETTDNTSKFHAYFDDDSNKYKQEELKPYVKYIVNLNPQHSKVFDNMMLEGKFYDTDQKYTDGTTFNNDHNYYISTDNQIDKKYSHMSGNVKFEFSTPLYQRAKTSGLSVTNREWIYKLAIPRNCQEEDLVDWGNRLRGKKMICEIKSESSDLDFALNYITTKFRVSWT